MKNEEHEILNRFLSQLFNAILKIEEKNVESNIYPDLSLRDIHVLETVLLLENEQQNTSTQIAAQLHITPGTLTSTVNLLVKKGYLTREKDAKDKRIARICVTERGKKAQHKHQLFHDDMVVDIVNQLTDEELHIFSRSVEKLGRFFQDKENSIIKGE